MVTAHGQEAKGTDGAGERCMHMFEHARFALNKQPTKACARACVRGRATETDDQPTHSKQ